MDDKKTEFEKKIEAIQDDVEIYAKNTIALKALKRKIDDLFPEPEKKEYNSKGWEAINAFFFAIVGGVAGVLVESTITAIVVHSENWWILLISAIALPLIFSFIFYYGISRLQNWKRKKFKSILCS